MSEVNTRVALLQRQGTYCARRRRGAVISSAAVYPHDPEAGSCTTKMRSFCFGPDARVVLVACRGATTAAPIMREKVTVAALSPFPRNARRGTPGYPRSCCTVVSTSFASLRQVKAEGISRDVPRSTLQRALSWRRCGVCARPVEFVTLASSSDGMSRERDRDER